MKRDAFVAVGAGHQSNAKTWSPVHPSVTSLNNGNGDQNEEHSSRSSSVSGYLFVHGRHLNYEYSDEGIRPSLPTDAMSVLQHADQEGSLLDLPSQRSRDSLFTASSETNEVWGYNSEQSAISQEPGRSMSPSDRQPNTAISDSLHAESNPSLHDNSSLYDSFSLPYTSAVDVHGHNSSMSHVPPSSPSQFRGAGGQNTGDVISARECVSRTSTIGRIDSKLSFKERSSISDTSRCSAIADTSVLHTGIVVLC